MTSTLAAVLLSVSLASGASAPRVDVRLRPVSLEHALAGGGTDAPSFDGPPINTGHSLPRIAAPAGVLAAMHVVAATVVVSMSERSPSLPGAPRPWGLQLGAAAAGTALASAELWLMLAYLDHGPGRGRALNETVLSVAHLLLAFPTAIGLGTWAAGEIGGGRSAHPALGAVGSVTGSLLGALGSSLACWYGVPGDVGSALLGGCAAAGAIGGAVGGYELLRGR